DDLELANLGPTTIAKLRLVTRAYMVHLPFERADVLHGLRLAGAMKPRSKCFHGGRIQMMKVISLSAGKRRLDRVAPRNRGDLAHLEDDNGGRVDRLVHVCPFRNRRCVGYTNAGWRRVHHKFPIEFMMMGRCSGVAEIGSSQLR